MLNYTERIVLAWVYCFTLVHAVNFSEIVRLSIESIAAQLSTENFPCLGILKETTSSGPAFQDFPYPVLQYDFSSFNDFPIWRKASLNLCPLYVIIYSDPSVAIDAVLRGISLGVLYPRSHFIFLETNFQTSLKSKLLVNTNLAQLPYLFQWEIKTRLLRQKEFQADVLQNYNTLCTRPVMLRGVANSFSCVRWVNANFPKSVPLLKNGLKDWNGQRLIVGTFHTPPHVIKRPMESGIAVFHSGIDIYLVSTMTEALKMKHDFREPPNFQKWGHRLDNASWDGLVGLVQAGAVDMGVANIFMTLTYLQLLDMPYPYNTVCISALSLKPPFKPRWQALLLPFTVDTWIFSLGIFLAAGLLLWLQAWVYCHVLPDQKASMFYRRIGFSYFYAVQSLTGIAGTDDQSPWPVRISVSMVWATFFLLTTAYRASLTACISFPTRDPPIDSLEQLLRSKLEWGGWGEEVGSLYSGSKDSRGRQVGLSYKPVRNITEALERASRGQWAILENRRFLEYTAATEYLDAYGNPTLHVMKECGMPMNIGIALPKNSPLKRPLDDLTIRLAASGLPLHWFRSTIRESHARVQRNTTSAEFKPNLIVSLSSLQGSFFVLILCYVPTITSFLVELWVC